MIECLNVCPPHAQCPWQRLWIHSGHDQNNEVTIDGWMNFYNKTNSNIKRIQKTWLLFQSFSLWSQ